MQKSGVQVNSSATEIAATSKHQQATVTEIATTTAEVGAAASRISATSKELARTMALTAFGIGNLLFSFTAKDEKRTVFSLDTINDRTFLFASLLSVGAIIFATELRFFQRFLDTVELTGNQWLICIGAGATVVVASELWKWWLRRQPDPEPAEQPAEAEAAAV